MKDESSDIAAKINAKRGAVAPARGEVTVRAGDAGGIAAWIERLRSQRVREPRDTSMGSVFAARGKQLKRESKGTGTVAGAWAELCPAHLLERTGVVGVTRGVLTLSAADAAARFEADRVLRCGVEKQLLKRLPLDVRRVRVVISADDAQ